MNHQTIIYKFCQLCLHNHLFIVLILFFFNAPLFAQNTKNYYLLNQKVVAEKNELDSFANAGFAENIIQQWVYEGYLQAGIDSVILKESNVYWHLHKGAQYSEFIPDTFIMDGWERDALWKTLENGLNRKMSVAQFKNLAKKTIAHYNNNGYPFANLQLSKIYFLEKELHTTLQLFLGPYVIYDSIIINEELNIKKAFLYNFLNIHPGEPYNEQQILQIENKLRSLPFINILSPILISFNNNKASVILNINKNTINKVDAIAGFAPQSDNNNNKLLLTGQADIQLHNTIGAAEKFSLFWQSFLKNGQSLNSKLVLPYLPYIKFGSTLSFDLIKFDTTFLTTKPTIAINFRNKNNVLLSAFFSNETTSLISLDTNKLRVNQNFPSPNATNYKQYGISLENSVWSSFINPFWGYSYIFSGSFGTKKIIKDSRIVNMEFQNNGKNYSLYDSFPLSFNQFQIQIGGSKIWTLYSDKWVLYTNIEGKYIYTPQIFLNELFRLGGFKSLRGFDEQQFFADQYALTNVEIRYRYNQLSNFFAFCNAMAYKNNAQNFAGIKSDIPIGFGLGANINTGNTILSLVYAYGKQKNIPINFLRGKFHFGFVNYF